MKAIWCTDIHLNFLQSVRLQNFYAEVRARVEEIKADFVFLTGDISDAAEFNHHVMGLGDALPDWCEIAFVLGNHDFYGGSVKNSREKAQAIKEHYYPTLMPPDRLRVIEEDNSVTMICGVDGFADARHGDFDKSDVLMNDHVYIQEFRLPSDATNHLKWPPKSHIKLMMQTLADFDASELDNQLSREFGVSGKSKNVIVLTHVPPFIEVARYNGTISAPDFLPFYTSKATGDILLKHAEKNPDINYLVLCGHSHDAAHVSPLPNLNVYCGRAKYNYSEIQIGYIEDGKMVLPS